MSENSKIDESDEFSIETVYLLPRKSIGNIPFESYKSVKETQSLNRHIFNLRYLKRTEMVIL